jgi:hypothetical protein
VSPDRPTYCTRCRSLLIETRDPVERRYDPYSGAPMPAAEIIRLVCGSGDGHDVWAQAVMVEIEGGGRITVLGWEQAR